MKGIRAKFRAGKLSRFQTAKDKVLVPVLGPGSVSIHPKEIKRRSITIQAKWELLVVKQKIFLALLRYKKSAGDTIQI